MYPNNGKKTPVGLRGYTLLEVLVALIVASLFLTIMSPAGLAAFRRIDFDAKKDRALFLAKSRLEWLSSHPSVSAGTTSGKDGNLIWEITVSDIHNSAPASGRIGMVLRRFSVRVRDSQSADPLVVASTQRMYMSQ